MGKSCVSSTLCGQASQSTQYWTSYTRNPSLATHIYLAASGEGDLYHLHCLLIYLFFFGLWKKKGMSLTEA